MAGAPLGDSGAGLQAFDKSSKEPGFEESSGCFSRLTLGWFTQVLSIGEKKRVELGDLGRPHPQDDGVVQSQRMQDCWDAEVQTAGLQDAKLLRVMRRFIGGRTLLTVIILAYSSAFCLTAVPLANKKLLQWLEGSIELSVTDRCLLVVAIFLLPLLGSFLQAHMTMTSSRTGVHLYAAFTQIMYRKSLRLSSHARNSASTGRLVNLMSNDAGTVMEQALTALPPCLTALPQLVLVLALLFSELGVPMFSGFAFILFSVPLAILVFGKIAQFSGGAAKEADQRLKSVNDLFTGIRVVKAYAWEKAFLRVIGEARNRELRFIKKHAYWSMLGIMCIYMQLPALMQLVTYITFVVSDGKFTASRIFTAIQLFQLLQQPLTSIPQALTQVAALQVAIFRIGVFLRLHELDNHQDDTRTTIAPSSGEVAVQLTPDAAFTWDALDAPAWRVGLPQSPAEKRAEKAQKKKEEKLQKQLKAGDAGNEVLPADEGTLPSDLAPTVKEEAGTTEQLDTGSFELKDIGLSVKHGELVAVVGPVGSGKSSLLGALLNEMSKRSGQVVLRGRVGYAAQQPWIQNATLRANVLFGLPYDEEWYDEVVQACALTDDLAILSHGDQTEIGERGINLSGGQKARVNLARAVYCKADVILLDDPLAAVDMHVGDTLFEKCICGLLKDKTVILVTNQLHRLPDVDRVAVMDKGSIAETGSYSELLKAKGSFAGLLKRQGVSSVSQKDPAIVAQDKSLRATVCIKEEEKTEKPGARLTQEETREEGYVSWRVYAWYMRNCGFHLMAVLGICSSLQCYLPLCGIFTLASWTEEINTYGHDKDRSLRWLRIYACFIWGAFFVTVINAICSAEARVAGARRIHTALLTTLTRAPVAFFDVTPLGRILNRFSKDLSAIDMNIMMMLSFAAVIFNYVLSAFVGIIVSTRGWLLIVTVPALIVYIRVFRFVRLSAVEIQRLQATTRSPLTSTFQELLTGLSTVRAYRQQVRFQDTNTVMMNQNIVPLILVKVCQPAWLAMRLNFIGALSGACTALFAITSESFGTKQSASLAGVGLTYSTMVSHMMIISISITVGLETMMSSVERVKEYVTSVQPEESEIVQGTPTNGEWPTKGRICVRDLVTGYRDGPNVLHGISADIEPCEKIGVVGRTGSGKSTIILSLLRLIEPRSGTVEIDGIDICKVGLEQLRSAVGLIPQDPVLFTGSVRYNIDPFSEFSDEQLWVTLGEVNMKDTVSRLENKLEQEVQEGGDNFSVGERQLFCIARALLRNPRILLLDEASASLDNETDAMLQALIRKLFKEKTVLTIAHRLETIMDSDRILVLDRGNAAEMGAPLKLLEDTEGIFSGLVKAGNALHLRNIAELGYAVASKLNEATPKAGKDSSPASFMLPNDAVMVSI